jgi:CheY-like chemotaxis protein/HPt (histidine-containing phosphotransfer) domain-containing protein
MPEKPSPMRVLVIDDDEMSRELLAVLLGAEGYAVDVAESGEAALQLLDRKLLDRKLLDGEALRPGLVLTDMQMPGMTATQLAGRLRRACGRGTLLLAMSGSRPPEETIAHFDGFLMKPFGVEEVAAALAARTAAAGPKKIAKGSAKAADRKQTAKRTGALTSLAASAEQGASNKKMMTPVALPLQGEAAAAASAAPVLDETIYGQLAGSMPAPQLHEMYSMCVNDARERIDSMRAMAAEHDAAQFMRQAHAIKGSCGMLGASELHRMAAGLEKSGPDTAGSGVNSLDELSAACDRLERMLGARA